MERRSFPTKPPALPLNYHSGGPLIIGGPPHYIGGSPEVPRMTRQGLKSIEQQNFRELKKKVTAWETAGIIDEIAAKIDEELENSR